MRIALPLDDVRVADPCDAPWNGMAGDHRSRFCSACRKAVHDLTAVSRADAESLLAAETRPCVRFVRDRKGRVVTADAPFLRVFPRRLSWFYPLWAGLVLTLTGCVRHTQGVPVENYAAATRLAEHETTPPAVTTPPVTTAR